MGVAVHYSPQDESFDDESQEGSEEEAPPRWKDEVAPPNDLDEDVYALAVSDLTRDFQLLANNSGETMTFLARFATHFFLLFACMFVQLFLLYNVKKYVTAKSVHDIRISYDAFETGMYTADPACYETTVNGFRRGLHNCFNASAFDDLSLDIQSSACRIPLSQPFFFGTILWVWTVVCMGQLYKTLRQFKGLILNTKTVDTMHTPFEGEFSDKEGDGEARKVIQQLTLPVKVLFTVAIILPKIGMTSYLLWLGSRWLLATDNFSDIILNAVALEFILLLGEVLYVAMLPERNRHDLGKTKMMPTSKIYAVGCLQFGKVFMFNLIVFAWVGLYMTKFQGVLPDYRWDVREVCGAWIEERFEV